MENSIFLQNKSERLFQLVSLTRLSRLTQGNTEIRIGLIDGPINVDFVDFNKNIIPIHKSSYCTNSENISCYHGTFIASMLLASRDCYYPGICPGCSLISRPIFTEREKEPVALIDDLISALLDCVKANVKIINLSISIDFDSFYKKSNLIEVFDYIVKKGIIIVIASGNSSAIGRSSLRYGSGIIPVAACNNQGKPLNISDLGHSIGVYGILAPGENIKRSSTNGTISILSGTSVATTFVTGTIALLFSLFPKASISDIILAIHNNYQKRPRTIVPPLLDAWGAYKVLKKIY